MSTFYEIDSSHVSFKEYWWGTKSPAVLIGWMVKLLRIRIPSSSDDPNTDSTIPFVVQQLPAEVSNVFWQLSGEIEAMGFFDPVYHVIHDPGTRTTVYWATYRHQAGNYFARIHQRVWQQSAKPNRGRFLMFFTEFNDGTFLVSSSGKPDMDAPATIKMNRMFRASSDAMWKKHLELTAARANGRLIVPVNSQADLVAATERHHILTRDFHLARRVFRAQSAAEQAQSASYAAAVEQGRASGLQHPEIIAELDKLQESKPAWRSTFWVLAGSLILFFALGAARWDWKFTLWLIPALFFHETGHWLMMRIFKYRNLRMFFIPMFGAAVIGQNWNVAGWKKALVSLAGPLPGIALGVVIGLAGVITHRNALLEVATILIVLNGFNLLPILPLDGGHFMQAILFCRNRWLDSGFRVVAVIGLAGLTLLGMGRMMIYLAIPMAIYIPVAFKLGKVTDSLRKENLPSPDPGQDRIPVETAEKIVSEVTAALPKNLGNKAAAQHSLNVFENLNARPPGILATIGLLGLYGGGVVVALLAGLFFVVAQQGRFSDLVRAAARQPRYAFTCGNIQSWPATEPLTNTATPKNVVVTTLANVAAAKTAFSSLTQLVPTNGQLTLFGQSLLITLPCSDDAAREQWFDRIQTMSSNTFVAISNHPVTFKLNFLAPTEIEATNLEQVLRNYFDVSLNVPLMAPWAPEAKSPRFATYDHERWMWSQIDVELGNIWTNSEVMAWDKKIVAARKRGSVTEADNLTMERMKAYTAIEAAAIENLKKNPNFDSQLVELHTQLSEVKYTNRVERARLTREVAAKLGAEATDDTTPASLLFGSAAYIRRNGPLIQLSWVSLDNPSTSLPAMMDWLCEHRCVGIRYEFTGSSAGDLDDAGDD